MRAGGTEWGVIEPLTGYEEYYRVDIGEYRVVYRYDDDNLWIEAVGKRNDDEIYRDLRKR